MSARHWSTTALTTAPSSGNNEAIAMVAERSSALERLVPISVPSDLRIAICPRYTRTRCLSTPACPRQLSIAALPPPEPRCLSRLLGAWWTASLVDCLLVAGTRVAAPLSHAESTMRRTLRLFVIPADTSGSQPVGTACIRRSLSQRRGPVKDGCRRSRAGLLTIRSVGSGFALALRQDLRDVLLP